MRFFEDPKNEIEEKIMCRPLTKVGTALSLAGALIFNTTIALTDYYIVKSLKQKENNYQTTRLEKTIQESHLDELMKY
ncbi:MAG: hypothetical protein WC584_02450 [Candidatus Pacearchaeota archaeon]